MKLQEQAFTNSKEVNKQDSLNKELIKREEVENSPFTIITVNKESFGTMGEYRITDTHKTVEAVRKELKKITWNRIVQVMMILNKLQTKNEK